MNDQALPDDLIEIIAEAEKLVADAVDADAKAAAAKSAIQAAVQGIVDTAQVSVSKLYNYLKPGAPSPILAIMWPVADAPAQPTAPIATDVVFAEPAPAEVSVVAEVPAADPLADIPAGFPVGEPEAPVVDPVAEAPAEVVAAPTEVVAVEAPAPDLFPVEPVGGEVAPQEPAFPVDAAEPVSADAGLGGAAVDTVSEPAIPSESSVGTLTVEGSGSVAEAVAPSEPVATTIPGDTIQNG